MFTAPSAIFLLRSDEHRLIDASDRRRRRSNLISSNNAPLRKYFFFFFGRKVGKSCHGGKIGETREKEWGREFNAWPNKSKSGREMWRPGIMRFIDILRSAAKIVDEYGTSWNRRKKEYYQAGSFVFFFLPLRFARLWIQFASNCFIYVRVCMLHNNRSSIKR